VGEPTDAAPRNCLEIRTLGVQKGVIFLTRRVSDGDENLRKCTHRFFSNASNGVRAVWFNSRVCDRWPAILVVGVDEQVILQGL
jgi:hypothetical protein